jgi:hypothetical protein
MSERIAAMSERASDMSEASSEDNQITENDANGKKWPFAGAPIPQKPSPSAATECDGQKNPCFAAGM